jgi:toxin-antitoxin system PIN domain toxin
LILPDVNVLVYAHVAAFPEHDRARRWWEAVLNGNRAVGLAGPALFGFIRIATNARVLDPPMTVAAAIGTVEGWLERTHVHLLHPGPRHLEIAFGLLREAGTAANLTTDAQLAALAIESQGEVHSNDVDFARFPQLRWVNPIAGRS